MMGQMRPKWSLSDLEGATPAAAPRGGTAAAGDDDDDDEDDGDEEDDDDKNDESFSAATPSFSAHFLSTAFIL